MVDPAAYKWERHTQHLFFSLLFTLKQLITTSRQNFAYLVGEHGAQALHDGRGGEVLRGDQLQGGELAVLLL